MLAALSAALFFSHVCRSNGMQIRSGTAATEKDEPVCFSLAAYEEPEWIDELIKNFIHFTEPSSRLSIHLNTLREYDDEQMKNWDGSENGRVVLSGERVEVRWFRGSILYSHLLNARRMESLWPGYCKYWMMQASNMFWVRKGVETQVRDRQYAQLIQETETLDRAWDSPLTRDMYYKGRQIYGWGQPEGAYFPMRLVLDFDKYMQEWLAENGHNSSYILTTMLHAEAYWLQYYALNLADPPPPTDHDYGHMQPPCFRHFTGPMRQDSVPQDEIEKVMSGVGKWSNFYAVKRVNRNLEHPVTKFVMGLAH